ncbi:MAG: hypothetical protein IT173_17920 [Acidobacteria bacterium]|nr:hypothetical protein [Acidobacteriota bacterium]
MFKTEDEASPTAVHCGGAGKGREVRGLILVMSKRITVMLARPERHNSQYSERA